MPVLWQSSQRPMYVRTVWVDGFRHAILSQEDPYYLNLKRRPHSSASTKQTPSRLSQHSDEFGNCIRKLNLVIKSGKSIIAKRPKSSYQQDIEELDFTDIEQDSNENLILKASPQPINDCGRRDVYSYLTMKNIRNNKTSRLETNENTELSDRVLQWLDLAGKVDLLAPEDTERMAQPRHSWPELQRRHNLLKSKTAIDIRAKESGKIISPKTCDSPKGQQNQQNGYIDRHEFYVPTSANTIENYARQSRNVRITPRIDSQPKTRDFGKPRNKELKTVAETRQKVATERSAVEKQYADMMNKKLIPDVSKAAKKQVHIFMPDVPKKPASNISNTTSRTESLMSQLSRKV